VAQVNGDHSGGPEALATGESGGRALRFGLAGTGYWARTVHGPALATTPGIDFTAVWGRNPLAAGELAKAFGATAHSDFGTLLADVDAVAFSVPPDVQSGLACQAAAAGRHLLLEKPIALGDQAADALVQAVEDAQVSSVVFFTARFQPDMRGWLAEAAGTAWTGGHAVWLGSALAESSPFDTPWRRQKGGLWDLGPHVVSLLSAGLGPVVSVTADRGPADVAHLVLHHEGGATSTATVTVTGAPSTDGLDLYLWGRQGRSVAPAETDDPVAALRTALTELTGNIRSGRVAHPCDVRFGRYVNRVLAEAQRQIDARRPAE
jgi:predicted dehydrogenase